MIRTLAILILIAVFLFLIRRRLIQVDLTFPWFVALMVLGLNYNSRFVDNVVTPLLGLSLPIYSIILMTLFLVIALSTIILIAHTRDHRMQIKLLRRIAELELTMQEKAIRKGVTPE